MSALANIAQEESKLEMTPMIDVTFLLLIFFMCTIKFKTLEGKLSAYLPKDVGSNTTEAEPKEKVEIQLKVLNAGTRLSPDETTLWDPATGDRFVFGSDRSIQYRVGPKKTTDLAVIEHQLGLLHAADPERGCTIDAQPGIVYGDVVGVLDAALANDFTDITFVAAR